VKRNFGVQLSEEGNNLNRRIFHSVLFWIYVLFLYLIQCDNRNIDIWVNSDDFVVNISISLHDFSPPADGEVVLTSSWNIDCFISGTFREQQVVVSIRDQKMWVATQDTVYYTEYYCTVLPPYLTKLVVPKPQLIT